MRVKFHLLAMALVMVSCSKDGMETEHGIDYAYGRELSHEKIVLGDRLENPYKTENISKALKSLYPTKADRVEVKTTDLYVRFLPADKEEYELLKKMGIEMTDHPLDYDIIVDGDWYHDPEIPEDEVTWQYAVVPVDFTFPDVEYEVVARCHIASDATATKADGIDWEAVEREAYVLTGNSDMLPDPETKSLARRTPAGRITIVDEHANGGKPFGVAGVKVLCNSFVKFASCHTDRDGYYAMSKSFSADLRYRLVFQNERGFSLGVNLVLVPASVSTLGKSGPEGVNMTVTKDSEAKLYRRCVVNNAAYDYYSRCAEEDLGIALPPSDLRIWIFNAMKASSAVMLHNGAVLDNGLIRSFLGEYARLVKFLLPDITIGTSGRKDYREIYTVVSHELAHASHFSKVGTAFWDKYIAYIISSFIASGGMTYGDGTSGDAGYCEIGEMWAYYLESKIYKDRYGGGFPTFGTSYWFYPQIFRYLDERGLAPSRIFGALGADVVSRETLRNALLAEFPDKRTIIEQVFSRY